MKTVGLICAACVAGLLAAPSFADAKTDAALEKAIAAVDSYANEAVTWNGFDGVLVIEQGGKRLYAKAFGPADRDRNIPITLETPFLIASQGKMFTAVAVLQLVEAGKVKLDEPVGTYLRGYPNREVAEKVTIRHLLTHRGGTGDMSILQREETENRAIVRSIDDLLRLNGSRPPAFEPGSKFDYSNYGFILLGAVVERVSGRNYYDYIEEYVFRPAGMQHSGFPTLEQMDGVAIGYTWVEKELKPSTEWLPWRGTPAGGGISTAEDLVRFFAALNAGKLISKEMLAEATRRQPNWGLGFVSSPPDEFPHWGHGGGAPGNSLIADYHPKADLNFVCLSNLDPPACDHMAWKLFEALAPAYGVKL
jgi:CubicO group peptidase (beta-lactamase class C family)